MNRPGTTLRLLMVVVAVATGISAGSASASTITSEGSAYTGEVEAASTSGAAFGCEASFKGQVEPSVYPVAFVKLSQVTYSNCPKDVTVTMLSPGTITLLGTTLGKTGWITVTGTELEVTNHQTGNTCIYKQIWQYLDVMITSLYTGATAEFLANAEFELKSGKNCEQTIHPVTIYSINTPDNFNLHW